MIKPTKENQKKWVKKYLNAGKCPKKEEAWWYVTIESDSSIACYDALAWLADAKPDITTLAEAWDRCPRGDWLLWALVRMEPTQEDLPKLKKLWRLFNQTFVRPPADFFPYRRNLQDYAKTDFSGFYYEPRRTAIETMVLALNYYIVIQCDPAFFLNAKTNAQVAAERIREVFGNPWREKC